VFLAIFDWFWWVAYEAERGPAFSAEPLPNIGCPTPTISEQVQLSEFIEITFVSKVAISEKIVKFYENGVSLQGIGREVGLSKNGVRGHLLRCGIPLRAHSNDQLKTQSHSRVKSIRTAPYGYCVVNGQLLEDPKEQNVLKLILKWWEQGLSHCAIARKLNSQKLRPRIAKTWSQPTISFIIKRHGKKIPEEEI